MAIRAGLGGSRSRFLVVTDPAVDPEIGEVLLMGILELPGIDLVMAGLALELHVVAVHLVRELHAPDLGRKGDDGTKPVRVVAGTARVGQLERQEQNAEGGDRDDLFHVSSDLIPGGDSR
jgi:hypothetical protein